MAGPHKSMFGSASLDRTIRLWDLSQQPPRLLHILRGHERGVQCIAFSTACAALDRHVCLTAARDRRA